MQIKSNNQNCYKAYYDDDDETSENPKTSHQSREVALPVNWSKSGMIHGLIHGLVHGLILYKHNCMCKLVFPVETLNVLFKHYKRPLHVETIHHPEQVN